MGINEKSKILTFEELKKLFDEKKITFEEFQKGIAKIRKESINKKINLLTDDIRDYLGGVLTVDSQTSDEIIEYQKIDGLKDLTDEEIETLGFGLVDYFCGTKAVRDLCIKVDEMINSNKNNASLGVIQAIKEKFKDKYNFVAKKRTLGEFKYYILQEYAYALFSIGIKDFHKDVILKEFRKLESLGNDWKNLYVKEEFELIMQEVLEKEKLKGA